MKLFLAQNTKHIPGGERHAPVAFLQFKKPPAGTHLHEAVCSIVDLVAEAEYPGQVICVDQPYIIVVSQSSILDSIISDISN